MKKLLLVLLSFSFSAANAINVEDGPHNDFLYHVDPVMNFDNSHSTDQDLAYALDCDADGGNNSWGYSPIEHGQYVTVAVPNNSGDKNNKQGCELNMYGTDKEYYTFYYQVYEDGGFAWGPDIVDVDPAAPGITICPHYDYADFRINQGSDQKVTTTYGTTITWKSTVNYSWSVGERIANTIAERIEASYTEEDDCTCVGTYNETNSTFTFVLTIVHVQLPDPIPEDCFYYPPGTDRDWPAGYEDPDGD